MSAQVDVLTVGYAHDRVASTVVLIRDPEAIVVVDPGMVASRAAILDPLVALGVRADHVTDVVFSHHHPDHTLNAALFENARFHDFMAIYRDDVWQDSDGEGRRIGTSVHLTATPGHTDQDVSTLVDTAEGLIVCTHLWWNQDGPADDPFSRDRDLLKASRERVLAMNPALVIPGHGAPFAPTSATPR